MGPSMKECYGILEHVFPMGDHGLREVPADCFQCPDRTECMRAALKTREGFHLQEDAVDRSVESGLRGRVRRWSRKKELERLARERDKRRRS